MSDDALALVRYADASEEVRTVFDDIITHRGPRGLTPTWGFFAHRPRILARWWELLRELESGSGYVEPALLHAIALVCAADVGCPRCINNHQASLIDHHGMDHTLVDRILRFEETDELDERWRVTLRFARKVAQNESVDDELPALRALGMADGDIVEIITVAAFESAMAKRSLAASAIDDGDSWTSPVHGAGA